MKRNNVFFPFIILGMVVDPPKKYFCFYANFKEEPVYE